ncbi:MAG: hypothetical protein LLF76_01400 [Planctomycetaceae bacterium]|nr:hypothetical protein [Planctomycetaceae bacterium]
MTANKLNKIIRRKANGFALLIVLAAIAIMMLVYVIQMDTLFRPAPSHRPVEMQRQPWAHENLLIPAEKTVKKPKAPKPLLTEPFEIAGDALRSGEPRGQVKVAFDTGGRIEATWQCQYASDGKTHQFSAQTAGNVNTKLTYEDANGADKTRLFFFSKGDYVHVTQTPETGTTRETGTAYVLGWLRPDRTAEGFVTITTDQKWSAEFAFQAVPPK